MKKKPCNTCGSQTRGRCAKCGLPLCDEHRFSYVDGSIEAITKNSPELCAPCYGESYWNG